LLIDEVENGLHYSILKEPNFLQAEAPTKLANTPRYIVRAGLWKVVPTTETSTDGACARYLWASGDDYIYG
jgi:hypothetical protein